MKIVKFGNAASPLLVGLAMLVASPAVAQVFVDEDFESYANSAALYSVWGPSNTAGVLVDESFTEFLTLDDITPQDVGARAFPTPGQGVQHIGGSVLEYQLPINGGVPLLPTPTKNVVLQGDIFDVGNLGNKRMSIGLRSSTSQNIVELGHWNASATELAGRAILFASPNPVSAQPNWQFYEETLENPDAGLPLSLDRPDDADMVTTLADLGEAWHTYRVTISETQITFQIDLFRDGLDADTGLSGWDATMTFDVEPAASGFDTLRIGGPSGVSSAGNGFYGGVFYDNIRLEMVDVVAGPPTGDYNGNGTVDAADYTLYRDTLGDSVATGEGADGNGNGVIDPGDYTVWANNFGNTNASNSVSVPEPSAALLACLAGLALTGVRQQA